MSGGGGFGSFDDEVAGSLGDSDKLDFGFGGDGTDVFEGIQRVLFAFFRVMKFYLLNFYRAFLKI